MRTLLMLIVLAVLSGPVRAAPEVTASIKPVHALVAGVMAGVGEPKVLIGGSASVHAYSMRPSDAQALNNADVVFWVGPALEMFLDKPLRSLARKARVVPLASAPGITTRPARKGGLWESDGHDHDHDHADHDHSHDSIDAHIWLDPANAKAMVAEIARVLAEVDPANAARYAENGVTVAGRIDELDEELSAMLAPVRARPFIVFHDAYQYFEQRYQLKAAGSITVSADRPPGAKRVAAIKAKVREQGAICVFAEPQFEPKLVDMMITGTPARSATLDPEGSALAAGADAYFVLMRTLGANLARCLQP